MPASQLPQQRPSLPQGLNEEALKEALQLPSIWVESQEEDEVTCQEIEREVALLSPFIQREVLRSGHGLAKANPVVLPKQVNPDVLNLLLDYCRFHRAPGRSDKERKLFDEKFIRLDTRRLCELTSAADALDMKPLVDLTSRALARMIEGKSAEEIRETFHLPDDLTEEEKLEPVKNATADPRIRLLNRLYAKKRKELAHKKAEEVAAEARARAAIGSSGDDRSLEDLLSFIGAETAGEKPKARQKKKRSKKKNGIHPAASAETVAVQRAESCQTTESDADCNLQSATSAQLNPQSKPVEAILNPEQPSTSGMHLTAADKLSDLGLKQAQWTCIAQETLQNGQQPDRVLQKPNAVDQSHVNGTSAEFAEDGSQDGPVAITAREDETLLANIQGFASALGCSWQVPTTSEMMCMGTLPLPGAQITTLTSLANFRPSQLQQHHTEGQQASCASSQSAEDHSQSSELDTDEELEAAFNDRQAANLRESQLAYDIAMSRVAAESNIASCRPHWPDDAGHASQASFDDWAANAPQVNGNAGSLTSHGSFSFANGIQEASMEHHKGNRQQQAVLSSDALLAHETQDGTVSIGAIKKLLQEFLQKAGLDSCFEIRTTTGGDHESQCQRPVTVQDVLPCGTFMKLQLH